MNGRTFLTIGIAGMFVIVASTVSYIALRSNGPRSTESKWQLPAYGVVPEFSLTEANGKSLRRADLREQVWIASFIFTRCAEACPAMMRQEVGVQGQLPVRDDLRLVSFSVDPDYDSPAVLRQYAEIFGVDRSRWLFLTGDKKQIYDLAIRGFKLATEDADPTKEMPILHSAKLILVDRRGTIRGYYDSTASAELEKLVRDATKLLAERS
jgi:cytochrome oxidase Cu insertion factor (SCO1/SenC/PrrC family)